MAQAGAAGKRESGLSPRSKVGARPPPCRPTPRRRGCSSPRSARRYGDRPTSLGKSRHFIGATTSLPEGVTLPSR